MIGVCAIVSLARAQSPPAALPATSDFTLLCTATADKLASDCRFEVGIGDPTERLKAGAVLAWLDAHPFPLAGTDAGATVRATVALQVVPATGRAGFAVSAPLGVFLISASPPIKDPVWTLPPYGPWADDEIPERSQRMNILGEATAACVVTADGRLSQCRLLHESPPDGGFSRSITLMVSHCRMKPLAADGTPVASRPYILTLRYPGAKPGRNGLVQGHWAHLAEWRVLFRDIWSESFASALQIGARPINHSDRISSFLACQSVAAAPP